MNGITLTSLKRKNDEKRNYKVNYQAKKFAAPKPSWTKLRRGVLGPKISSQTLASLVWPIPRSSENRFE